MIAFGKPQSSTVVVQKQSFAGNSHVDFRVWKMGLNGPYPTKQGVKIAMKDLPALIQELQVLLDSDSQNRE